MKKHSSIFEYPIVLRQNLNFLTISVPDLGISLIEELPNFKNPNKDYVTLLGKQIIKAWIKADAIVKSKSSAHKYVPSPSMTREAIKMAEKDLTPATFAKLVGVSKCTAIRDCKKGIIRSKKTSGGHYRIPHSQVNLYMDYLKQHKKHATDHWLKIAMEKLQKKNEL